MVLPKEKEINPASSRMQKGIFLYNNLWILEGKFGNGTNKRKDRFERRYFKFFDRHVDALPLYEELEGRMENEMKNEQCNVQKSQISFYKKPLSACVSFAPVQKK